MKSTARNKGISIVLLLCISLLVYSQKGYEIKVTIPSLKDSTIILGHYQGNEKNMFPDDTVRLNKKGYAAFKGVNPLAQGLYFIYVPSKGIIDIIVSENQHFGIETDTANLVKGVKFKDAPENTLLYTYRNFRESKWEIISKLNKQLAPNAPATTKDSVNRIVSEINREVDRYAREMIRNNPNLFLAQFLKMLAEAEIPDYPRDANGVVLDSTFRYKYVRKHYFDNFNYADNRILRTPLYEQKLKYYFDNIVPPWPDTIKSELDIVLTRVMDNPDIFRYVLGTFYNKYAKSQIMGYDAIVVHLAENWYLPHATWLDSTSKASMTTYISRFKHNLIGNIAPNIPLIEIPYDHFMVAQTDTALKRNVNVGFYTKLHAYTSKFLVVVFWQSDCGHCKKALPELHETYRQLKGVGVEVLAIHCITSEEGKIKWIDFVNEHQLHDWHNAWSPMSYEYQELFNAYTFPTLYVLDQNKKIIAKQLGVDQIKDFIDSENKRLQKLAAR